MHQFIDHDYFLDDFRWLDKYWSAGDNFIDVGANIGTWTDFAAKKVGLSGRVLSFEPHPVAFKHLRENVGLNNTKNI